MNFLVANKLTLATKHISVRGSTAQGFMIAPPPLGDISLSDDEANNERYSCTCRQMNAIRQWWVGVRSRRRNLFNWGSIYLGWGQMTSRKLTYGWQFTKKKRTFQTIVHIHPHSIVERVTITLLYRVLSPLEDSMSEGADDDAVEKKKNKKAATH